MQSLLHASISLIFVAVPAFIIFDLTVNVLSLWKTCKPQQIITSQEVQEIPEASPQQEKLPDIWEESEEIPIKQTPIQPTLQKCQLLLSPAKEVPVTKPTKKRGRPKKSTIATTLPTAEAELAATFCQPTQIAVTPAKKRGRPKKSVA